MINRKLVLAVAATATVGFTTATANANHDTTRRLRAPARGRRPVAAFVTLEHECATYDGLQAPDGFSVNLVTDIGKIDDGTFNQFAYEGMTAANECFGIEDTSYIETVSEADYAANIATSLESDPNVLVTVGFLLTTRHPGGGQANPDVELHRHRPVPPGVPRQHGGVQFTEDESGYIAGVLAASLSESGVIGVVGGRRERPAGRQVRQRLHRRRQSVNPDIRVLSIYNESFTDPAKGASDAAQFIGEGADVIFGAGGQTGSGGIAAAAEAGVWAIGVDQDEYYTTFAGGTAPGSEFLASSAIKRVDLVTFRLIADAVQDQFERWSRRRDRGQRPHHLRPAPRRRRPADVTRPSRRPAGLADGTSRPASAASTACRSARARPATRPPTPERGPSTGPVRLGGRARRRAARLRPWRCRHVPRQARRAT